MKKRIWKFLETDVWYPRAVATVGLVLVFTAKHRGTALEDFLQPGIGMALAAFSSYIVIWQVTKTNTQPALVKVEGEGGEDEEVEGYTCQDRDKAD